MDTLRTTTSPKLDRSKIVWISLGLGLILVAIALWTTRPGTTEFTSSSILVQHGAIYDSVPINAVLVSANEAILSTTSGGTVTQIVAVAGQKVRAGDSLLQLANPELAQQLEQARFDLAVARSDASIVRGEASDAISMRRLELVKAQNQLKIARIQLQAESSLQEQGIISRLTFQKTKAELDDRLGDEEYAKQLLAAAVAFGDTRVKAAMEKVSILQSRADSLNRTADQLSLRAPFEGLVANVNAKIGEIVGPGVALATVISPKLEVDIEVSENLADRIKPGQKIRLRNGLAGAIVSLAPGADGGVIKGHGTIDGDTSQMRTNAVIPAVALLESHGTGTYIEANGLNFSNQSIGVKVKALDGSIESRTLVFGQQYGNQVLLLQGAKAGEIIVGVSERKD